jgi:hypothetical protein
LHKRILGQLKMKKNDLKLEVRKAIGIIFDVRQKLDEVSSIDHLLEVTDRLAYAVSILANTMDNLLDICTKAIIKLRQQQNSGIL